MAEPPASPASNPIRVVLVDDHPALLDGIRGYLEDAGGIVVVGTTTRGAEVLPLVRRTQPDVLLLDLFLPGISGDNIARTIRLECPDVALLVLTGHDDARQREALLRIGVRGYLLKTEPEEAIVSAVRAVAHGGTLLGSLVLSSAPGPDLALLTKREREIFLLVLQACRNLDIATQLGISVNTVEYHVSRLLNKLGARSRWELIARSRGDVHVTPLDRERGGTDLHEAGELDPMGLS